MPAHRLNLGLAEFSRPCAATTCGDWFDLQADGGLKTGLDVIKAAILGAESFGFGTAPMVALAVNTYAFVTSTTALRVSPTQNQKLREDHFRAPVKW